LILTTFSPCQASRFNSYEAFCSGHPEALDIVRKVQQQNPVEWDAFEQRAASLISDGLYPQKCDMQQPGVACFSDMTHGIKEKNANLRHLSFMDYLIKPVQRVCKYPLLLAQLKSANHTNLANNTTTTGPASNRGTFRSNVDVIVESAVQAMRHAANAVDEARHRQDMFVQSSLIASRIFLASPSSNSSTLTPTFLTSLGVCLLAGSLDVMHYPASGATIKARYLGAFLYMGGYLVMVKVRKGKVYEPRHWFSLGGFELTDLAEDDGEPVEFSLV
jgi:RhoGEF domain